jgi:hypothetical protein
MAAGSSREQDRADQGEWVISGGEEGPLREPGQVYVRARGNRLTLLFGALIIVLLAIVAAASLTGPLLAQRPWVGPWNGHEEIVQGLTAGRAMKVRVILRNSGRSPALDTRIAIRLLLGNPPPAPSPALGECAQADVAMPQTVLFPDAAYSKIVATQQQINDDTVEAVLRKDKTVYLAGCVQYTAHIMEWLHLAPRQTHFCRIFVPTSAGVDGILGTFEDCPAGNSAD